MTEYDLKFLKCVIEYRKSALAFADFNKPEILDNKYIKFGRGLVDVVKTYHQVPSLGVLQKTSKEEAVQQYIAKTYEEAMAETVEEKDFEFYFKELKDRYKKRKISAFVEDYEHNKGKTIKELEVKVRDVFTSIQNLDSSVGMESRTLKENLSLFTGKFNEMKRNKDNLPGIPTKYTFFDNNVTLRGGDMLIIGGETGAGKSTLMTNFVKQMWMQDNTINTATEDFTRGYSCVIFSVEMPYDNYFTKLLACISGIDYRRIEMATLSKEEMDTIKKALDFINRFPFQMEIVDIPQLSSAEVDAILDSIEESKFRPDFVCVDYLGIMDLNNKNSNESDWLKQGEIARELRTVFRKRDIPGITAVQLNRKKETKNAEENIGTQRVSRSMGILTHCTTFVQIESRVNEDKCPDMRVHIVKNRNGGKGMFTVMKKLACSQLVDLPVNNDTNEIEFADYDDISDETEDLFL